MFPLSDLNSITLSRHGCFTLMAHSNSNRRRLPPKNLRYPRRAKLPPQFGVNQFLKKPRTTSDPTRKDMNFTEEARSENEQEEEECDYIVWDADELDAISSLFQGRIPQKPGNLQRERPLPLPVPHKLRPLGLPTPKRHVKFNSSSAVSSSRDSVTNQVYKNPRFLIGLAREISGLKVGEDVSLVLSKWVGFLKKGSLSLTIRELGHLGLTERALQTFSWAKEQSHLFPDDRILASTIEVLASNSLLKAPFNFKKFTDMASRDVLETMIKGFIKGGNLRMASKLLLVAKDGNRTLSSNVYAKLIIELGKYPDEHANVAKLLNELGEREELDLSQQDCIGIMKVCINMRKFDVAENLFNWFKDSGRSPTIVMYTTLIHCLYSAKKFREALAVVWEMEASNYLFDLPAYRVVIKLFVAMNDLPRARRYFSKLKESGFSPMHDIYRDMIEIYMVSGRRAKCMELCKEAEKAGIKLHREAKLVAMNEVSGPYK